MEFENGLEIEMNAAPARTSVRAFTIIEIAVVLVIIGLIIGGVMGGKELIRSAQLNSIISQYKQFSTAANEFKQKYSYLPGDFPKATKYWGSAVGGANADAVTCITSIVFHKDGTCNGDGDDTLKNTAMVGSGYLYEQQLFWSHLSKAGFVTIDPTGIPIFANPDEFRENLSPESKFSNAKWAADTWRVTKPNGLPDFASQNPIYYLTSLGNLPYFYNGAPYGIDGYGNVLYLGVEGVSPSFGTPLPLGAILTPLEQAGIDRKIDDGKPGSGILVVYAPGGVSTCTTTNDTKNNAADYLYGGANASAVNCLPVFINAF